MKLLEWLKGDKVEKMLVALRLPEPDYEALERELRKSELDRELIEQRLRRPSGVTIADLMAGAKHDRA